MAKRLSWRNWQSWTIDRGNLPAAHRLAEQSLSAFESLRLRVVSPNLRASLVASARQVHELNIEILQRLHAEQPASGFDAAAFRAAERGRARSLLEVLGESGVEIRRGVDTALLDRERELQRLDRGQGGSAACNC